LDAELLLLHVINKNRVFLFSHHDEIVTRVQLKAFQQLLKRRIHGEPVAYILQHREFWSLPFKVTADTLIPRTDTERLVELALRCAVPRCARVLDLGSGTGAIGCALASEQKEWSVLAIEKNEAALAVLRENITALKLGNVTTQYSDWFASVARQAFDIIVSNPPYIAEADPHLSQGDLRFEPRSALTSGHTGLRDIEHIVAEARFYLSHQGWLLLEHGYDQGAEVNALMKLKGYSEVVTKQDLAGNDRVTLGRWTNQAGQ
jgi:release factor glutamine methyltransferase